VRDDRGQPVAQAVLLWTDDRGTESYAGVENGAYSAPGLSAGHMIVQISGRGWHTEQFDVALDAQPSVQQRDFTAHANAQILIKLVDADGQPIFGSGGGRKHPGNMVRAMASRRAPPALLGADSDVLAHDSECARFANRWELTYEHKDLATDVLGVLELLEPPPLFVSLLSGAAVLETRELTELPAELVFTFEEEDLRAKLGGLRVRLLEADGRTPAAGRGVELFSDITMYAKSDPEGRAELHDILPGGYGLTVNAEMSAQVGPKIVIAPGQILDLGDVTLVPVPMQLLRFVFPEGKESTLQFVFKPEIAGDPLQTLGPSDNRVHGTEIPGPTRMSFPGPGTYELRVTNVGDFGGRESLHFGALPQRVVLGDQPAGEIVVRIEPTTEVLLKPARESRGEAVWLLSTADGLPCRRVRIAGRAPGRIELVPGSYTIAHIDPATRAIGSRQAFTVGGRFTSVELQP